MPRRAATLLLVGLVFTIMIDAQDPQDPSPGPRQRVQVGRSKVATKYGIVAASQPLAARAGVQILERGGNAIDAAIAANAVMGLVEPHNNGIGGDLFAIYYEAKTGKVYGLNAGGWAPSGTDAGAAPTRRASTTMPNSGIYSVTVPGAVKGWEMLRSRFGTLPMADILAPAIFYAEDGFPVTDVIANAWNGSVEKLQSDPNAATTFLIGGRAPRAGEVFKNPQLAGTLRLIARKGPAGFYEGKTAEAILDVSREKGGTMTAADLKEYQPEWVDPISTTYRGWTVHEIAAEHAGHRRADDAQHDGAVPARRVRPAQREGAARDDRSEEARLRRHAALRRRSGVREGAGAADAEQGPREGARGADRSGEGRVHGASRRSSAGSRTATGGDTIYLSVIDATATSSR